MRTAQQLIWKTSGRPERDMLAGLTHKMGQNSEVSLLARHVHCTLKSKRRQALS